MVEDVDVIIHTAAIVGFPECKDKPELAKLVNVHGTDNLLSARDAIYKSKPPRFVYCSTGSVYGKLDEICTEESPCNPQSLYGETKLEAEKLVAARENTVSLRFATGCGLSPKMRFNTLVNELCYDAYYTGELVIAEPNARRTFIDVQDMVYLLMTAATEGHQGISPVYNAGSNSLNLTKKDIAELIRLKTRCRIKYEDFIIDQDKRDYEVDYSKFRKDFGTEPRRNMNNIIEDLIWAMPLYEERKNDLR